jgi:hypothetical protein
MVRVKCFFPKKIIINSSSVYLFQANVIEIEVYALSVRARAIETETKIATPFEGYHDFGNFRDYVQLDIIYCSTALHDDKKS